MTVHILVKRKGERERERVSELKRIINMTFRIIKSSKSELHYTIFNLQMKGIDRGNGVI